MLRAYGFFAGLLAGFVLAGAGFFAAVFALAGTPVASTAAAAPILELKRQLAAQPAAPKCLLVGGSSVDLGLSARRIEELSGVPTRNFGLWVPLGLPFLLSQAAAVAQTGDTVVLALEYELYDWPGVSRVWADPQGLEILFAEEAGYLNTRSRWERIQLALRVPLIWPLEAGVRPRGPWRSFRAQGAPPTNFNRWGDRTDNVRAARSSVPEKIRVPTPQLRAGFSETPKSFPVLTAFFSWARTNQVRVVATFPNLARNAAYDAPAARRARDQLQEFYQLEGIPFIGTFEAVEFAPEDCYDTPYHLFDDVVLRRTDQLVGELLPYLRPRGIGTVAP